MECGGIGNNGFGLLLLFADMPIIICPIVENHDGNILYLEGCVQCFYGVNEYLLRVNGFPFTLVALGGGGFL
jgi:hypothetical protein